MLLTDGPISAAELCGDDWAAQNTRYMCTHGIDRQKDCNTGTPTHTEVKVSLCDVRDEKGCSFLNTTHGRT